MLDLVSFWWLDVHVRKMERALTALSGWFKSRSRSLSSSVCLARDPVLKFGSRSIYKVFSETKAFSGHKPVLRLRKRPDLMYRVSLFGADFNVKLHL
ncbi:hypothetical protein RRG08_007923 [Elysia crispata]|uniref:Uncharacterized protein n=1 Tax=Elysia crispata TaxID=231223 RepID=A0AAE0ZQ25_9GAST|nr:hypothetical protein RRG08_007923 [Elysia crispata]